MTVSSLDTLLEEGRVALRALVGRDDADFREGQWDAVRALVADRGRVLVVQRTGWGKSAVYFVATALLRAPSGSRRTGPTLIVSPLLALMRDQIAAAGRAGVRAVTMNSANAHAWDEVAAALAADEVDVLLVSPERLENPRFRAEQLPRLAATCGLVVVDEAHCISDWGHDFRPDYRRIRDLLATLPPGTPVLATTATANARVVEDVADQLAPPGGGEVTVLRGPLARASLRLGVLHLPTPAGPARVARGAPRRAAGQRHRLRPHRVRRAGRR
jgi:ATP-dependent DNA helicase RecQ